MKGYFRGPPIKLSETFLDANGAPAKKIQLLRVGEFKKGKSKIPIAKKHLLSMVDNFKKGVRGIDLMVDYGHDSEGEAAAWFTDVFIENDGNELWAEVDWTDPGRDDVAKKKYRYISSDFDFEYEDNETGKKYGPTLFGAALTNRPVIKRMTPVVLGEQLGEEEMTDDEKEKMEKLQEQVKKLTEELAASSKKAADFEKEKKLAEEKAEADKKLAEKNSTFDKMLSEGKVVEAQRDPYLKDDIVKFTELQGEVKLAEKGVSGEPTKSKKTSDGKETVQEQLVKLADAKADEKKISLSEATSMVLSENKELADKYYAEVG